MAGDEDARRERAAELARDAYRRKALRERYPHLSPEESEQRALASDRALRGHLSRQHPGLSPEEAQRRVNKSDGSRRGHLARHYPGVDLDTARRRAAAKRYRQRHGDEISKKAPAAHARQRDKDPDAFRARARDTYWDDPDKAAARYQRWYQANLEQAREAARNRARLKKRLERLGLPPRRVPRVYAEVRRANTAAADAFFREVSVSGYRRRVIGARHRLMSDQSATPQALIDRFHLANEVYRLQGAERNEALRLRVVFEGLVERHRARMTPAIAEETRMDSVARVLRGAEPLDLAAETESRLRRAVFGIERGEAQRRASQAAGLTWREEGVRELMRLKHAAPERLEDAIARLAREPRTRTQPRRQPPPPPEVER